MSARSIRPSDVSLPRDDSMVGTLRRLSVWGVLAVGFVVVPIAAAQLAAFLLAAEPPALRWRASLGELVDLANPAVAPARWIALAVGLAVSGGLYGALATMAGSRILRATGLRDRDRRQREQLDGARWAEKDDLTPLLVKPGQLENRLVLGTPLTPRVRGDDLVAVESGHSALVVAPTGQGKTESVMVPSILDWDGPVLVVSIKRDVYDLTAGYRGQGGETRVLDPAGLTDPTEVRNAYWTPLAEARSWRAARMLADQMAGVGRKGAQSSGNEDYFAKAAGELLAGLFFAAAHSPVPTMRTVGDWLTEPEDAIPLIEQLLGGMAEDESLADDVRYNAPHALRSIRLRMIGKDPRTVEPIRATAANIIRAWDDYRLADIKPTDPGVLDPEWLWAEPSKWERPGDQRTLYVICPDAEQGTYEGMIVGAVTQAYNAYGRAGQEGRTPPKRLRIVLDEVANTAPIPKLDTWVTAARGLGINLVVATQNLAQLDTVWGREKAETIASGPRVRMFGPGLADEQTLSYIEKTAARRRS
jgi:type IV secretion system protein VirD4